MRYKYATVLEAQNDGRPPNDNIEEGDKILKAGKHDEDRMTYLDENNETHQIVFESVEVYEFDDRVDKTKAEQLGKDRYFSKQEEAQS